MDQNLTEFCRNVAISNDYEDFIIEYQTNLPSPPSGLVPVCYITLSSRFAVFHQPRDPEYELKFVNLYGYNMIPDLFGLLDTTSVEATGTLKVRRQPYLDVYGNGTIIGFVDTGIDYQNPLFQNADGTTRIISIWDQADQSGDLPPDIYYGSEYTREDINRALQSDTPLSIVPSTDELGHGTFMAGIAAGGIDTRNDFTGIAPNSDIVMVKLKQAKPYLKSLYAIGQDKVAYSSNDIMMGIHYIWEVAKREKKPVVVCIGVGSNAGDHTGRDVLSSFLNLYGDLSGNCIVIAGGNEGNRGHHFRGELSNLDESIPMEIRVGRDEPGFTVELWGQLPNLFSINIVSPTGQVIPRRLAKLQSSEQINLTFEKTSLDIRYNTREERTGDELIFIRFQNPTEGIWTVNLFADTKGKQTIDAWLPMEQLISEDTYFIRADPDVTITQPGNTENAITVAAYNHLTGSIYISCSRGPTRNGRQEPIVTAPGVDVYGPVGINQFGVRTGTSIAAANTAGLASLLFEWGIIQRNSPYMNTTSIKHLLVSGADRTEGLDYPNNIWGYGTINLYESFNSLRLTS